MVAFVLRQSEFESCQIIYFVFLHKKTKINLTNEASEEKLKDAQNFNPTIPFSIIWYSYMSVIYL